MKHNFKKIEPKWQKKWETEGTFFAKEDHSLKKWYGLVEFPYPSGQGLHVGHPRSYTALDIIARKKRLEGYNVLYPIGFDAFGLPAENYAIKNHIHPKITTEKNVNHFREQLKALGFSFDWSREINTTDPNYYKWTQWIFIQLYKHGLAYKTTMPINYCTGCKVGLANEEVVNGVCERCGSEVEYTVMKQWFIDIMSHKEDFLRIGNEINWYPSHMHNRYEEWVNNVAWDWCISRQRYFGVPFPVWYCKECGEPIFASKEQLPVNPLTDTPPVEKCSKCGCKEFIPESDVMDTWATSSVTPLINMKYGEKDNYESILKPMSLRSNASEIIRTWDFYTIVKSYYHFGIRPWDNVMISGFVMANKGEKISKSKGNSNVEPLDLIKQYSADVVRYWAASGRLGTDITYSEETLLRGKKLVNKIWNVSKLIQMHLQDYQDKDFDDFEYVDKWILGNFIKMEKEYIKYLDNYEIGLALNILEKFFWNFCDNYIEIVKHRLYRPEEFGEKARYSGQKTVYMLLYKLLQDFSVFFPFITEEIYQDIYHDMKSIHITEIKPLNYSFDDEMLNGDLMCEIISAVRGEKSSNNLSLKTTVKELDIDCSAGIKDAIKQSEKDFKATLFIEKLILNDIEKDYKINKVVLDTENS